MANGWSVVNSITSGARRDFGRSSRGDDSYKSRTYYSAPEKPEEPPVDPTLALEEARELYASGEALRAGYDLLDVYGHTAKEGEQREPLTYFEPEYIDKTAELLETTPSDILDKLKREYVGMLQWPIKDLDRNFEESHPLEQQYEIRMFRRSSLQGMIDKYAEFEMRHTGEMDIRKIRGPIMEEMTGDRNYIWNGYIKDTHAEIARVVEQTKELGIEREQQIGNFEKANKLMAEIGVNQSNMETVEGLDLHCYDQLMAMAYENAAAVCNSAHSQPVWHRLDAVFH